MRRERDHSRGTHPLQPRARVTASTRAGWAAVAVAAIGTLAAMAIQSPAVRTDPAFGLLAAMQHEAGRSPDMFTVRVADPGDLTRDTARRVSEWAPAYQALPYSFRRLGLSWGDAVRMTGLLAWTCGATGWALYFGIVLGRSAGLPWLVAALLMLRPSHDWTYAYSGGEALEWGAFPGVLLVNLWAMTRRARSTQLPLAALGGALAAGLFLVRYGATLPGVGLGAAWVLGALAGRWSWRAAAAWGLGAGSVAAAVLAAGFPRGLTPLGRLYEPPAWAFAWPSVVWPLALTDLDGLVRWVLLRREVPVDRLAPALLTLGLLTLVLVVLVWRAGAPRAAQRSTSSLRGAAAWSAPITLGVTVGLLAIIYARGSALSFESRHLRLAALCALPFLCERMLLARDARTRAGRCLAAIALGILLGLPAAWGAGSLVDKAVLRRGQAEALVGPQAIRLDFLEPAVDARALYAELETATGDPRSVLLLPHPEEAFAVADRRLLLLQADGLPLQFLRTLTYRGRPTGGMALLLPRALDRDGRRQALQAAFVDLHEWQEVRLESAPAWALWRGR
jgi:hypothetical protein